jgi:FAD/FMN-containing dehydrogenase
MDEIVARLMRELGPEAILLGDDVRSRPTGWMRPGHNLAKAIVRPRTTAEVSTTLRLCWEANQPVVPQGGLTGLVGGATPNEGDLALSLERMTAIEEVDVATRTMVVQAGVPLQAIQQRADEHDLLFPLDLGARGSCTIGGNVASNAGGNRVIRYGMTRDMVLGLEAVLADGTVLSSMNRMIKNNAGYDLKHLFIGSEGTLGVVTRVVLRLRPKPKSHNAALVACDRFEQVTSLLQAVDGGFSGMLSAFEVMWEPFYKLVTSEPARNRPPLPYGHPYYILIEALGSSQERDSERFETVLDEAMAAGFITDAVLAKSRAERDKLWAMRDDVEQMGRLAPIFTYDISLPIPTMPSYVEEVRAGLEAKWKNPGYVVFGHLGDGNLHVVVGVGSGDLATRRQVEEIVYGPLRSRGGSVSAEHGIGIEKRKYLSWSRSEAEIAVMRALKQTLDPRGILNPGKVIELAQGEEGRRQAPPLRQTV